MDKKRLEEFKKGDVYALASLLPEHFSWGTDFLPTDMQCVISPFLEHIAILEEKLAKKQKALEAVKQAFEDNDSSKEKSHPWIPGGSAQPVLKIINSAIEDQT